MKKLLFLMIVAIVTISCKKEEKQIEPVKVCDVQNLHEGKYVGVQKSYYAGVSSISSDTIQLVFTGMDSNCKPTYTIKGLYKTVNNSGCFLTQPIQDYYLVDNTITNLSGGLFYKSTDPTTNWNIQITYTCSSFNMIFTYKKI